MSINLLVAAFLLATVAGEPSMPSAGPPPQENATSRARGQMMEGVAWVPYVQGSDAPSRSSVSSGTLLLIAFGLMWLVLLAYSGVLLMRTGVSISRKPIPDNSERMVW